MLLAASAAPTAIGKSAADDAVGAEIALCHVGDVHRAAAAAAIAGRPCRRIRRTCVRTSAPLAMQWPWPRCVDGDVVVVAQRHADADGARLLADRQMHGAVDRGRACSFLRALLEPADEVHLVQRLLQPSGPIFAIDEGQVRPARSLPSVCFWHRPCLRSRMP